MITDSVSDKALDHSALVCKLLFSLLSPKSHKFSDKTSKNIDLESLSNALLQKFLSLPSYQDTNALVKFYNGSLKDVLDDFAPLTTKQIQRRKTLPWYSPEIKDAKKNCAASWKDYGKNQN